MVGWPRSIRGRKVYGRAYVRFVLRDGDERVMASRLLENAVRDNKILIVRLSMDMN